MGADAQGVSCLIEYRAGGGKNPGDRSNYHHKCKKGLVRSGYKNVKNCCHLLSVILPIPDTFPSHTNGEKKGASGVSKALGRKENALKTSAIGIETIQRVRWGGKDNALAQRGGKGGEMLIGQNGAWVK